MSLPEEAVSPLEFYRLRNEGDRKLVWIDAVVSVPANVQPHVVPYDEDGRLVSRILHNVFLLGNLDKEAGALAFRDSFFHMVGRQHALKATNGVIARESCRKILPAPVRYSQIFLPAPLTGPAALLESNLSIPIREYASAMWRGIIKLVVLVVLIVVVAAVLSPYFDLQPTTLGKSHRATVQLSVAVPLFLAGALHASPTLLIKPRTVQSHRAPDILARDCARLC